MFDLVINGPVGLPELDNWRPSDVSNEMQVQNFRRHILDVFENRKIKLDVGVRQWDDTRHPRFCRKSIDRSFSFSGAFDWRGSAALKTDRERVMWLYVRFGDLRQARDRKTKAANKKAAASRASSYP